MFKKLLLAVLALTAVAQTVSAQGLRKDGDNYYLEALANGKVQIGTYGTGDFEIVLNAGSTAPVTFSFDAAGAGLTIPTLNVSGVTALTGTGANTSILRSNQTGTLGLYSGTSADYSTGANIALDGDDLGGADAGGNVLINTSDNANADVSIDINGANSQFRIRNSADADQFTIERFGLINTYHQIVGNGDTFGWSVQSGANTACTATCTKSAVVGFDTGTSVIVGPADATADLCLCAGDS